MASVPAGGPVEVAGRAYRGARVRAQAMSDLRLRWGLRTLLRHQSEGRLDDDGLVRLRALVDENRVRGMELPS